MCGLIRDFFFRIANFQLHFSKFEIRKKKFHGKPSRNSTAWSAFTCVHVFFLNLAFSQTVPVQLRSCGNCRQHFCFHAARFSVIFGCFHAARFSVAVWSAVSACLGVAINETCAAGDYVRGMSQAWVFQHIIAEACQRCVCFTRLEAICEC